ncbi:MAG: thioredoxin [Coriobacteriales bacterium]|jgi:thioredoxin 1|nr:thioredoxin [Coriobacteriales bacterium]
MSNVATLNADDFDATVLKSDKPYLVDFWASWCGPCRVVAPIVEQIATEYADKLNCGKLDIDANPAVAGAYRVMSIPTLILFKGGEPVAQSIGAVPKEELLSRIEAYL